MLSDLLTSDDLHALYRLRAEREENEAQVINLVVALTEAGESSGTIASVAGLTDTEVSTILKFKQHYAKRPLHDMCRKYYIGKVTREELINFLVTFEYGPPMKFDEFGESDSNGWDTTFDLEVTCDFGYIDEDLLEEVYDLLERKNNGA